MNPAPRWTLPWRRAAAVLMLLGAAALPALTALVALPACAADTGAAGAFAPPDNAPTNASVAPSSASDSVELDDHKLLVMLRLPAPHYRPDASYGGNYPDDSARGGRRRTAQDLASQHGLKLLDDWPMPVLNVDCYVMQYPDNGDAARTLAELQHDPRVAWAQQVTLYHGMAAATDKDALAPVQPAAKQWRLADIHQVTTGRSVSVAVIDSGIDGSHPDLVGQISRNENFVSTGSVPAEAHGTAIAGIIAARAGNGGIIGVAPDARVMGLRACWQLPDQSTRCNSFTLGKAINFAILNNARIINLSLSGPRDRLLEQLVDVALERGITVVGAIDPHATVPTFPSSHPGVLAVAAQASGPASAAAIPSLPAGVLLAPGRDIPATAPGARWQFVNGSSYAAAHVSGMLALLRQLQPDASPAQMQRLLLSADGKNAGNIDACASISRLTKACTCACAVPNTATLSHGTAP
jgi:subtilisin family serine protease